MTTIRLVKPPIKAANVPTRHLYVSGVGAALGHTEKDIEPLFSPYGVIDRIELVTASRFVFVSFLHVDSAIRAMEDSKLLPPPPPAPTTGTNTTKFFLKYAWEAKPMGPLVVEPDCTSTTAGIHVPGCHVIPSFITTEEEERLLCCLQQHPWVDPRLAQSHMYAPSAAASNPSDSECSRRVQHYGFPFNYTTLLVDPIQPSPAASPVKSPSQITHTQSNPQSNSQSNSQSNHTLPFPSECVELVDKMVNHVWIDSSVKSPSQTTHSQSNPQSNHSADEMAKEMQSGSGGDMQSQPPPPSSSSSASSSAAASPPLLSQLTVNEYEPGQGIGSHIDTYECFGNDIFVLSIGSGIVMTLQKRRDLVVITDDDQRISVPSSSSTHHPSTSFDGDRLTRARMIITEEGNTIAVPDDYRNNGLHGSSQSNPQSNHTPLPVKPASANSPTDKPLDEVILDECESSTDQTPSQISQSNNYPVGTKKHIWLPPRSLLLLSGESRYLWSHGIARRGYDKVDGVDSLQRRGTRLSLTFRSLPAAYHFPVKSPSQIATAESDRAVVSDS